MDALTALSPLDGRYRQAVAAVADSFSEAALINYRLHVEVEWFLALADNPHISQLPPVSPADADFLRGMVRNFSLSTAQAVKAIERQTNHDVKAVEYYLKQQLIGTALQPYTEFIHFACTSEDINNLAYALMIKEGVGQTWLAMAEQVIAAIEEMAHRYSGIPMLAHTHGQPASPTTVGKEMAVFSHRLQRQYRQITQQQYLGKINGAVGNFNAHYAAYPELDWAQFAATFVEQSLGLTYNPLTTQIESHDYLAELFHALSRFNTILLDFVRDVWLYIAWGYFKQNVVATEVGSSTMPHKVNPIDFENAEGNLATANALFTFMAQKLPVSRWQRDLSDSTVQRNIGTAVGYSVLALKSVLRGIGKVQIDQNRLQTDLEESWEVVTEAVQTVMRKWGLANPYEQLKAFSRGKTVTKEDLAAFINSLSIPTEDKNRLLALTPFTYIGVAETLSAGHR